MHTKEKNLFLTQPMEIPLPALAFDRLEVEEEVRKRSLFFSWN